MRNVVIVGASLAGLRTAEALRANGFAGDITIVGSEKQAPYDRPPLSKAMLLGRANADSVGLPHVRRDVGAHWELGRDAIGLDPTSRQVYLDDGRSLSYDGLVIATGVRARPWSQPAGSARIHTIRDVDDAVALRADLDQASRRVVIIGGGFIGCEVASAATELGHDVTLISRGAGPLASSFGEPAGPVTTSALASRGIDVRVGATAIGVIDSDHATSHVQLDNGSACAADVVIAALGAVTNTEWLVESGLQADAGGVLCDSQLRAVGTDGHVFSEIVAVGDVARWPSPILDNATVRVEHWQHALDSANAAAKTLVGIDELYNATPIFWSNMFGYNVKAIGFPEAADSMTVVHGNMATGRFLAVYGLDGRIIGAVAVDMPREIDGYLPQIMSRSVFPPEFVASDAPERRVVLPTRGNHE